MHPIEMILHAGLLSFVVSFSRKTKPLIENVPRRICEKQVEVSILIPLHNEAKNLAKLLSCLYAKKHDAEIIFINDASTDNSLELLENHKDEYGYKVITIAKQFMVADVLNEGLKHVSSNTNYIGVLNGDCYLDNDWYEKTIDFLEKNDIQCLKLSNYSRRGNLNTVPQYFAHLEKNYKRHLFCYEEAFFSNGYFIARKHLKGWKTITEDMHLSLELKNKQIDIYQHPDIRVYDSLPNTWSGFIKQKYRWMYGDIVNRCLYPPQNIFAFLVNIYYFFPAIVILTGFQIHFLNRIQFSILCTETLMHYHSDNYANIFVSFIYAFSQYIFAQFFYITLPFKKITW